MPDKPIPLFRTVIACVLTVVGTPAGANLPEPVRAMIEAARDGSDATTLENIVRVARQTNPGADAEIDALLPITIPMLPIAAVPSAADGLLLPLPEITPSIVWSGEGELGGFLTTGKTQSFGASLLFKLSRSQGDWKHSLAGRADYQETGGVLTREFLQLSYKADWKVSDTAYAFGLVSYERDRLAGFYGRGSTGAGLGLKLANSEAFRLNVEGGPAVRHTDFTDGQNETGLSARGALGIDWRMTDSLRAQQNAAIYTEPGATSVESTTALETRLMKKLSARLSHSLRHERGPLASSVGTDTVTRASVVYSF